MSEKNKATFNTEKITINKVIEQERESRRDIALSTQELVEKLDRQRLADIELEFQRRATREELENSIKKLENHSICTGNISCPKETPQANVTTDESIGQVSHGDDCHCSKCCPNPNPTWFERHKTGFYLSILVISMIILAIGWSPTGNTFEAIQKAYVELIVNLPKMAILAIGAFAAYKAAEHLKNKDM